MLGLVWGVIQWVVGSKHKRSEFTLNSAINYFHRAADLFDKGASAVDQHIAKWNAALELLKSGVNLSKSITTESHKEVYVTEYLSTAYKIEAILPRVKKWEIKFFMPGNGSKASISVNGLSFLLRFLKKAISEKRNFEHFSLTIPDNCITEVEFIELCKLNDDRDRAWGSILVYCLDEKIRGK